VRAEPIRAAIANGAVEGHLAVDRKRLEVRRGCIVDENVAIGRFGGDLAADVGEPNAFVHRGRLHAAARFIHRDHAFDRTKRHRPVAAGDAGVTVHGFHGDLGGGSFDGCVEIGAREIDRHPAWHRDLIVHEAARSARAAGALRANPQRHVGRFGGDGFSRAVGGLDPHLVALPRPHHHFAGIVAQHQPRALGHVHGLVRSRRAFGSAGTRLDCGLLRLRAAIERLCQRVYPERECSSRTEKSNSTKSSH
jgi:hypothetical protein